MLQKKATQKHGWLFSFIDLSVTILISGNSLSDGSAIASHSYGVSTRSRNIDSVVAFVIALNHDIPVFLAKR